MRKSALALGAVASICLAGTAAPAAFAQSHAPHAKAAHLSVKVSPAKPHAGTTVVAKATGLKKGATYACIYTLYHKGATLNAAASDTATYQPIKAKSSKATCKSVFLPFHATGGGKTRHCPPTKADKKAHWTCGVAFANLANHKQYSVGTFKF